jgi:hypothetical protein
MQTGGRLIAFGETGKILWRVYTVPEPGEIGSDTLPAESDAASAAGPRSGTRWRSFILLLDHGAERQDRRICPAFPGGAPRYLGLRCGKPVVLFDTVIIVGKLRIVFPSIAQRLL